MRSHRCAVSSAVDPLSGLLRIALPRAAPRRNPAQGYYRLTGGQSEQATKQLAGLRTRRGLIRSIDGA